MTLTTQQEQQAQSALEAYAASHTPAGASPRKITDLTLEELNEVADSMNATAKPGAKIILYSGFLADVEGMPSNVRENYRSMNVAIDMAAESKDSYDVINNTEIAGFLESKAFNQSLEAAIHRNNPDLDIGSDAFKEEYNKALYGQYDGEFDKGKDITGFWGKASKRYVLSATGDVELLAPNLNYQNVFSNEEFDALLANPNIKTIAGIDKKVFSDYLQSAGDSAETRKYISDLLAGASLKRLDELNLKNMNGESFAEGVLKRTRNGLATGVDLTAERRLLLWGRALEGLSTAGKILDPIGTLTEEVVERSLVKLGLGSLSKFAGTFVAAAEFGITAEVMAEGKKQGWIETDFPSSWREGLQRLADAPNSVTMAALLAHGSPWDYDFEHARFDGMTFDQWRNSNQLDNTEVVVEGAAWYFASWLPQQWKETAHATNRVYMTDEEGRLRVIAHAQKYRKSDGSYGYTKQDGRTVPAVQYVRDHDGKLYVQTEVGPKKGQVFEVIDPNLVARFNNHEVEDEADPNNNVADPSETQNWNEFGDIIIEAAENGGVDSSGNTILVKANKDLGFANLQAVHFEHIVAEFMKGIFGSFDAHGVGAAFGSHLGMLLTDNPDESALIDAVLGPVLGNISEFLGDKLGTGHSDVTLKDVFDEIGGGLEGVASSYISAFAIKSFGLNGTVVGDISQSALTQTVTNVINNIQAGARGADIFNGVVPTSGDWSNIFVSYLGDKLLNRFWTPNNKIEAYTSAVYSTLISVQTTKAIFALPIPLLAKFALAVVAYAYSKFIGGLIGSIFGAAKSYAKVSWDTAKGEFIVEGLHSKRMGNKEAAEAFAGSIRDYYNAVLAQTGAKLMNGNSVTGGEWGMRNSDFTYWGLRPLYMGKINKRYLIMECG